MPNMLKANKEHFIGTSTKKPRSDLVISKNEQTRFKAP